VRAGRGAGQVEHFVFQAGDPAQPRPDVPAPPDPVGRRPGGQVERPGCRRPPVGQQRFVVGVGDAQPADVASPAVGEVQPPEAQPVFGRVQLADPVDHAGSDDVPLQHCLRCAADLPQQVGQLLGGLLPQPIQPAVQHRDVRLLRDNVRG
jgi:hypothetical protein